LITRIGAAVVGLAFLLPAIIYGGPLAVSIIVALVMMLCVFEYAGMAFPDDAAVASGWLLAGLAVVQATQRFAPQHASLAFGAVVVATMVFVTLRPGESLSGGASRLGRYILGISWIGLLGFVSEIRELEHGLAWVFMVLASSWCADTGGYFAGKFFGERKLYPRVSPKKTWVGLGGGALLAAAGAVGVARIGMPELGVVSAACLGFVMAIVGVLGDLAESLLKRAFEVKDSGWIMPGHGGLLDRIDSVLFVAPVVYGYAVWMQG
jgi:phosphatidate cytidylyltransferase